MKNILSFTLLLSSLVFSFYGCEREYDEPPVGELPVLTANTTLQTINAMHTLGNSPTLINDSLIAECVVICDDRSGNLYKNLVVQDASAGVMVRLNATNLYANYPVGRKVYLKLKGLYIGDYNGVRQITAAGGNAIEETLVPKHLVGGAYNQPLTPRLVTPSQFSEALVNTLIKIDSAQFDGSSRGQTYADAVGLMSVNLTLQSCRGGTVAVRTSGYANFAGIAAPSGNGTVVAVLGAYNTNGTWEPTDYQLTLRDLNDVVLNGPLCGGGGGGGTGILAVRNQYTGTTTNASSGTIQGTVISDRTTSHTNGRNMIIQDANAGITVRFTANHTYNLGDVVSVNVGGLELSEFGQVLQLNNVPSSAVSRISSGATVVPITVTANQITGETYESRLVKIDNATIQAGTFSGTKTVTDASGTVALYTPSTATFATSTVPTGTVSITAIGGQFNATYQIGIRNTTDITGGGGGGGTPVLADIRSLRDDFASGVTTVSSPTKIRGVVISDYVSANITGRNLVIQDGTAGIVVRMDANHTFALNQEVEIVVTGQTLSLFSGLLQVTSTIANTTTIGAGTPPTPVVTTLAALVANYEQYESILVKIEGVTLTGGTTYSGTAGVLTMNDGSGSTAPLYTRSQATFAAQSAPTGQVDVTAIVSDFNGIQLNLRNPSDVQ